MILQKERELIVEYGKKMVETGLTLSSFGNLSVYDPQSKLMAITPSGMDYFAVRPEDIVVLTPDGEKIEGDRKPSSEYDMHRIFYQRRPGINAVVHAHSKFATTLACLNWGIPPLHYLIAYAGRDVPCTPYVRFGTYDLAEAALKTMGDRMACLLGNHGLLACGGDLPFAFDVAQQIEFVAEMYYRSKAVGEPALISDGEIDYALEAFKTYAVRTK
jgi:L-fuculose-phosphate aldolase